MTTEFLKMTAEIVISHASLSELSTKELVEEIKDVFNVLSSLESGAAPEIMAAENAPEGEEVKKPPIPLKDIVKDKYVVCLECGKKMRTLKVEGSGKGGEKKQRCSTRSHFKTASRR